MSKAYRQAIAENPDIDMRDWCRRPGMLMPDGTPQYITEQHHKDECDINHIIAKYDKQGVITHINRIEAKFGDFRFGEFHEIQNQVIQARGMFDELPSKIRSRFSNDPGKLLDFMSDAANREEAIQLGLIRGDSDPAADGLGEHVKHQPSADSDPDPES